MEQRTRSEGTLIGAPWRYTYNGVLTSSGTIDTLQSGQTKTMTDVIVPDFHSRQKSGEIFNNPMTSIVTEPSYESHFRAVRKKNSSGGIADWDIPPQPQMYWFEPIPEDLGLPNLRSLAGTQALASVMEPDVMSLVEIAEAKSTFRLMRKPVEGLHKEITRISRTRGFKKFSGPIGSFIASNWLKYRYGIMPLVFSVQDLWTLATKDKASKRMTARGYASDKYTIDGSVTTSVRDEYQSKVTFERTHFTDVDYSVRAGILYEWDFQWLLQSGLSYREVPSALWELVPYSFVVDWFANTSDVIRALTPMQGIKYLSKWTTEKTAITQRTEYEGTFSGITGWTVLVEPSLTGRRTVTTIERKPGIHVGLTSKLSQIDFETPRDWKHLADSLALIKARLS